MTTAVFEAEVAGPNAPEEENKQSPDENTPPEQNGTPPDDAGKAPEQEEKSDEAVLLEVAGLDMSELSKEYMATGALSEESYAELAENGFPKDVVDAYIRGVKAASEEASVFAAADVAEIKGLAGGDTGYDALLKWAEGVLSAEEKDAYNSAVTGGNKHIAALAVRGLVARHEAEYGHDPELVNGGGLSRGDTAGGYKNRSEMVAAMKDKRYGRDPEYTKEVEEKTLRSRLMRRR